MSCCLGIGKTLPILYFKNSVTHITYFLSHLSDFWNYNSLDNKVHYFDMFIISRKGFASKYFYSVILKDKTMTDKYMYNLNDTQNYPFSRLLLVDETFGH